MFPCFARFIQAYYNLKDILDLINFLILIPNFNSVLIFYSNPPSFQLIILLNFFLFFITIKPNSDLILNSNFQNLSQQKAILIKRFLIILNLYDPKFPKIEIIWVKSCQLCQFLFHSQEANKFLLIISNHCLPLLNF